MSSAPVNFYIEILIKVIKIVVFEENEIKDQVELKIFAFVRIIGLLGFLCKEWKPYSFNRKAGFREKTENETFTEKNQTSSYVGKKEFVSL